MRLMTYFFILLLSVLSTYFYMSHRLSPVYVFDTKQILMVATKEAVSHHLNETQAKHFGQVLQKRLSLTIAAYAKETHATVFDKDYVRAGGVDITPIILKRLRSFKAVK